MRPTKTLELRAVMQILKLSPSRYHAWKRAEAACELDDTASCPRSKPSKLTAAETMHIVEMALVEVTFSNSKIEAFWRSLRHAWLTLNELDSIGAVERLVRFYVKAHNTTPHSSFRGSTPDELCHGTADKVVADLAEARKMAREARLAANRSRSCGACMPRAAPAANVMVDDAADEEERAA